jgi:hypothetical protein
MELVEIFKVTAGKDWYTNEVAAARKENSQNGNGNL